MNSRVRLIIFDLDGTLVDSRRDIAAALNVKPERVWPDFKTFRDR